MRRRWRKFAPLVPAVLLGVESVMKLVTSLAVLDAVDRGVMKHDEPVLVQREDLSVYVQPLAALVGERGYSTTVADLIHRAVVDSDSAAVDVLLHRMGGPARVQEFLRRKRIVGIRVDREERHLQAEIVELLWRPAYVDPRRFDQAIAAVPADERTKAYRRYQTDARDTATPHAFVSLLQQLASGVLLRSDSTQFTLATMAQTVTFPDRWRAGVPAGWTVMHKTGTSRSWNGVTAAKPASGSDPFATWKYRHVDGVGDDRYFTFVDRTGSGDYVLAPSAGR